MDISLKCHVLVENVFIKRVWESIEEMCHVNVFIFLRSFSPFLALYYTAVVRLMAFNLFWAVWCSIWAIHSIMNVLSVITDLMLISYFWKVWKKREVQSNSQFFITNHGAHKNLSKVYKKDNYMSSNKRYIVMLF